MNVKPHAKDVYKKFSHVEGNQHIASEYALYTVLRLVDTFKIESVLEVGLGIGSIADTILSYAKANDKSIRYVGTEANEFCLTQLPINLHDNFTDIRVENNLRDVKPNNDFDLIVVDGTDAQIGKVHEYCSDHAIIYIEGHRGSQVNVIREALPNAVECFIASDYKNPDYGPFPATNWAGGGTAIFVNPTAAQRTFVLKEKASTKLKYIKRKLS